LIGGASSVALRRLLVVAGFLSLLVLALAVAFVVTRLRERELAER
jgi:HAMP domain-containing protein